MTKTAIATAAVVALVSSAQAADKKAKTPEQACQAQALASIAREWPTVLHGTFEIILRVTAVARSIVSQGHRCLVLLQVAAVFEDKRTALLDGKKVNPTLPLRRMARNHSSGATGAKLKMRQSPKKPRWSRHEFL